MANFFNPDTGYQKKTLDEIINEKRLRFESRTGRVVDASPASDFSILNDASSLVDEKVNKEIGLLLDQWQDFVQETTNQLSKPAAVTFEGVVEYLEKTIPRLEFKNVGTKLTDSTITKSGEIKIYLIFENNVNDSDYSLQIWEGIHFSIGIGISTLGDKQVSRKASNGQIIAYSYSLGKRLYVYIKVRYLLDEKNYVSQNIVTTIENIYQNVVNTKYKKISQGIEYQDFLLPTYQIQGISRTDFYYYISEDPNLDIKTLDINDFTINQNKDINPNEALVFDLVRNLDIDRAVK